MGVRWANQIPVKCWEKRFCFIWARAPVQRGIIYRKATSYVNLFKRKKKKRETSDDSIEMTILIFTQGMSNHRS